MGIEHDPYTIQGIPLMDLCAKFGTPLYVYDAAYIQRQIAQLRKGFGTLNIQIKYAAKALTNLWVLNLVREQGCGIDAVSIHEVDMALKVGFRPDQIIFTPSGAAFDEIQAAVDRKVSVNLDNLPIVEHFSRFYGTQYPCCIRINPSIEGGLNANVATGHEKSKFGIPLVQLPRVEELVREKKLHVDGVHTHVGSEITAIDTFLKIAHTLFDAASRFPGLRFIDIGSGFKPGYVGNNGTDIEAIGAALHDAFDAFTMRYDSRPELWIEPGKYIVSGAGLLLVRVNVVKPTPLVTFVGVDSGLNHLIRPMLYGAYHEIVNVSNPDGPPHVYTVVGNVCETDTFGEDRSLSEVREGDLLAIKGAGAYGFTMASSFNARPRPAEVMVVNGNPQLIRRRETFNDLLRGQLGWEVDEKETA